MIKKLLLISLTLLLCFPAHGNYEIGQGDTAIILLPPFIDDDDPGAVVDPNPVNTTCYITDGSASMDLPLTTHSWTKVGSGLYTITMTANSSNTLGMNQIGCIDQLGTVFAPHYMYVNVLTSNWWDSKYSTDKLEADIVYYEGNTDVDAAIQSECADALTAYDPPTDTEMDTKLDMIQSEVVTLGTAVDTVDNYVDTEITTITTYVSGTNTSVTLILEDTGTTLDDYVDGVETSLAMIQSEVITLGDASTTIDSEIATLQTDMDAVSSSVRDICIVTTGRMLLDESATRIYHFDVDESTTHKTYIPKDSNGNVISDWTNIFERDPE